MNFIRLKKINFIEQVNKINWLKIVLFYSVILIVTYFAKKLPNFLQLFLHKFTDINFPWNYNHGIAVVIVSIIFYKYTYVNKKLTFFGENKFKTILFPIVLFLGYSIYGINNEYEINKHLWALIFCSFSLIYNLMEEYTWRGYFIESIGKATIFVKGFISGVFWGIWHLLIFKDFEQFGGFYLFLLFCVLFSLILTFSTLHTKSIIVPATFHTLLIRTNLITLICFVIFVIFLFFYNKTTKTHNP